MDTVAKKYHILCIVIIILTALAASINASADGISGTVENSSEKLTAVGNDCEKPSGFKETAQDTDGYYWYENNSAADNLSFDFVYTLTAAESGYYELYFKGKSNASAGWYNAVSLSLNGGESYPIHTSDNTLSLLGKSAEIVDGKVNVYDLGSVWLKSGDNKITLTISGYRKSYGGYVLCTAGVYAERLADDIRITAESPMYADSANIFQSKSEGASSAVAEHSTFIRLADSAQYTFYAPKSGTYSTGVFCRSAALGSVTIDGKSLGITERKAQTNPNYAITSEAVTEDIFLTKGRHTIKFNPASDKIDMNNGLYLDIDYARLNLKTAQTDKVSLEYPNGTLGIFESDGDVRIKFITETNSGFSGHIIVKDFYGNIVYENSALSVAPNSELILKNLPIGHYTVYLGENDIDYFAVVKPLSGRIKYESSPFAIDAAAAWNTDIRDHKDYVRAMELLGVGYVRERLSWDHINGSSINNFALDLSTKPYAQKGGNGGVPIRYDLFMQNYKNAGIKVLPDVCSMASVVSRKWKNGRITSDLKSAYDYGYYIASTLGNIGVYELWNEPETDGAMFRYESPDMYAAMIKAMSIGIKDGCDNSKIASPAFASFGETYFTDMVFKNDLMKFFDIYNYHAHRQPNSETELLKHLPDVPRLENEFLEKYHLQKMPRWNTECGLLTRLEDDRDTQTPKQQRVSANYSVVSATESLAQGTDKHFWYLFTYMNGVINTNTITSAEHPSAIYSALYAMIDILGDAKYKGKLNILPDDTYGYITENTQNGKETAVIFSETAKQIILTPTANGEVFNLMGNKIKDISAGEAATLDVSESPIYLRLDGRFESADYEKGETERSYDSEPLAAAERIIINQIYPNKADEGASNHPENSKLHRDVKTSGYKIDGEPITITVDVINLNPSSASVTVVGNGFGYAEVSAAQRITLEPYEKKSLKYTVSFSGSLPPNEILPLEFHGEIDGQTTTKSVSQYVKEDYATVKTDYSFANVKSENGWDRLNNTSANPKSHQITTGEYGGMELSYTFSDKNDANKWALPYLKVADPQRLKNSTGLVMEYYLDAIEGVNGETVPDWNDVTFIFQVRETRGGDSAAVYLDEIGVNLTEGYNRIYVPWSRFSRISNTDENAQLDPDDLSAISTGIKVKGASVGKFSYTVISVGAYFLEETDIYDALGEPTASSDSVSFDIIQKAVAIDERETTAETDGEDSEVTIDNERLCITPNGQMKFGEHTAKIYLRYADGKGRLYNVNFMQSQTPDVKLNITGLSLDGKKITDGAAFKSGKYTAKTEIKDISGEHISGYALVTQYSPNDELLEIEMSEFEVKADEKTCAECLLNLSDKTALIKVFAFDDLRTIKPLSKTEKYKISIL